MIVLTLSTPNLISQLSPDTDHLGRNGLQLIDASTWQQPEIRTQADEIYKHETVIFKIIMKKNGVRMSITPAVLRAAKEAHNVNLERQRQACLLRQGGKQIATTYTCPFMMARCNGKKSACASCQPLLATGELATKPKWPTCPFGTASCTFASRACIKCRGH